MIYLRVRWIFAFCLVMLFSSILVAQTPDELVVGLWSPDGEMIATGSLAGRLNIWSKELKLVYSEIRSGAVTRLSWSPDSTRLALRSGRDKFEILNIGLPGYEIGEKLAEMDQPGVRFIKWSPAGNYIATSVAMGDSGYEVQLWDASGLRVGVTEYPFVSEHNLSAESVLEWSPDGRYLASANEGRVIITDVYDFSARLVQLSSADALAWSPDGRFLAVNRSGGATVIYDTTTEPITPFLTFTGAAGLQSYELSWSPDGRRLVSSVKDGETYKIIVFSAADGSVLASYDTTGSFTDLNWSADSQRLVYVGLQNDPDAPPILLTPPDGSWHSSRHVAFSPDNSLIAEVGLAVLEDETYIDFIYVWDVASDKRVLEMGTRPDGHETRITSLSWSPDGRYLVTGSYDGGIVWEIRNANGDLTGTLHKRLRDYGFSHVAWSPDGTKIAVAANRLQVWDVTNNFTLLGEAAADFGGARWSPDSSKIAVGMQRGIAVYSSDLSTFYGNNPDHPNFLEPEGLGIHNATSMFDWNPTGTHIAALFNPVEVRIRELATGKLVLVLTGFSDAPRSIRWDPTGLRLAVAGESWVEVWDIAQHRRLSHYDLLKYDLNSDGISWSSDGTQLVYADNNILNEKMHTIVTPPTAISTADDLQEALGNVRLFDKEIATDWSPDGKYTVVGGTNALVQVNNLDGTPYLKLVGHAPGSTITAVAWSPDGTRVISASTDETVRIWGVGGPYPPGILLAILTKHFDIVLDLAWSPDGQSIVTVTSEGEPGKIKIWDGDDYHLLREGAGPNIYNIAWSPDSSKIAMASYAGLVIYDAATLGVRYREGITYDYYAYSVDWHGERLAVGTWDGDYRRHIYIYDTSALTQLTVFETQLIEAVTFSPDGLRVAVQGQSEVQVWDWQNAMLLASYPATKESMTSNLAWSPDGTQLAYGDTGTTAKIVTAPLVCSSDQEECSSEVKP